MKNLYSIFLNNLKKNNYIYQNGKSFTFKEINNYVIIISRFIHAHKKINKILVISENQIDNIAVMLAAAKLNKTIIPLNIGLHIDQIIKIRKIIKPDIAILSKNFLHYKKYFFKKVIFFENILNIKEKNLFSPTVNSSKNKKFIITFSSGTTSQPKPIIFSQNTKYYRFQHIKKTFDVKNKDVILNFSTLDHSLGQRIFLLALLNGNSLIFQKKLNIYHLKKLIKKFNISFSILPSNYLKILKKYILSNKIKIKKVVSAASGISLDEKLSFFNSKIKFYEMYGASEIGTITSLSKSDGIKKFKSVGKVLNGAKIKILDDNRKTLNHYKVGEISCKTNLKFENYFNNKKLTSRSFYKGYFLTGDLGYLDNKKYLYFVSRKRDLIITSGLNIYPSDIENKISKLKNIKEVAVIGLEDEYYGEVVSAVCVLKKKSNNYETKIRGFLLKSLATFQQPVNYFFVEKLPKNSLGKVLKYKLRKKFHKKI